MNARARSAWHALGALVAIVSLTACNDGRAGSALPASGAQAFAPQSSGKWPIDAYHPRTFLFTGATQDYEVPLLAKKVQVSVWGAGNGQMRGAHTNVYLRVNGGEKFTVVVGGQGQPPTHDNTAGGAGGWGGRAPGGNGGDVRGTGVFRAGFGGGGATYVQLGTSTLLVVVGGVGGSSGSGWRGGYGDGGDAPDPGGTGTGKGGGQDCGNNPRPGGAGQNAAFWGGGGGGGGYCAGGGGSGSSTEYGTQHLAIGGGGGAAYVNPAQATTNGFEHDLHGGNLGDGTIRLVPNATQIFLTQGPFQPGHLAVDKHGNLYISHRAATSIRMVAPNGAVTQVGSGLRQPEAVSVDNDGNVFVADWGNNRVVKIAPPFDGSTFGTMTTIVPGPTHSFLHPYGVTLDGAGHLYVSAEASTTYWAVRRYDTNGHLQAIVLWNPRGPTDGAEVAIDPFCIPAPGNGCYVYVQATGKNVREIQTASYAGIRHGTIPLPGSGDFLVNNASIVYSNTSSDEVGVVKIGGVGRSNFAGLIAPAGLAVERGCANYCALYIGEKRPVGRIYALIPVAL